jgi:NTE family protein
MKKIGLALSSGGARGFSHIGVIKALMENKTPIHYIVGTSMGSIIAAYYALHKDVTGLELIVDDFNKADMLSLIDVNDPRKSIVKGDRARLFLKRIFGDKTFADTKIPLRSEEHTSELQSPYHLN